MPELDEIRQAVQRPWADFAETVIVWHRSPAGYRPLVVGPANTAESNMADYQQRVWITVITLQHNVMPLSECR
jgi:hypothetical protein